MRILSATNTGNILADKSGKPLTLYHGTNMKFNRFDSDMVGKGGGLHKDVPAFFFSGSESGAKYYAQMTVKKSGGKKTILRVNLIMKKPKYMDINDLYEAGRQDKTAKLIESLKKKGYDGIICESEYSPDNSEYVAFYPEQIIIK